eukprot:g44895.t1
MSSLRLPQRQQAVNLSWRIGRPWICERASVLLLDVDLLWDLGNGFPFTGTNKVATLPIEEAVEQARACFRASDSARSYDQPSAT